MINHSRFDIYREWELCYTVFIGGDTMNQRLSQLPAPALAGVVKERKVPAAIAEIKNCTFSGATMIDLHLPYLESTEIEDLGKIISSSRIPILALNYKKMPLGEDAELFETNRVESLLRAVQAGAAGIDMQGYTFDQKSKHAFCGENKYSFTRNGPKEVVTDEAIISRQCDLIERVHQMGREVLLSCHPGIFMNSDEVVELALFLEKRNPDILKIVTKAENEDELMETIRTMTVLKKEIRTPIAFHASGSAGIPSRILNPLLGGHIAFCVDRYDEHSVMEQIDLCTAAIAVENIKKLI